MTWCSVDNSIIVLLIKDIYVDLIGWLSALSKLLLRLLPIRSKKPGHFWVAVNDILLTQILGMENWLKRLKNSRRKKENKERNHPRLKGCRPMKCIDMIEPRSDLHNLWFQPLSHLILWNVVGIVVYRAIDLVIPNWYRKSLGTWIFFTPELILTKQKKTRKHSLCCIHFVVKKKL